MSSNGKKYLLMDQSIIRKNGLKRRRTLSVEHHEESAIKIFKLLRELPELKSAQNVGVYIATEEEISLQKIIKWCYSLNKKVSVPVITDKAQGKMIFVALDPFSNLMPAAYNILEPVPPYTEVNPEDFDVILVPLVAFDKRCNRVGMGGGFYDTAFNVIPQEKRPVMIGCSFECQKVNCITPNDWDVKVDKVVTELRVYENL